MDEGSALVYQSLPPRTLPHIGVAPDILFSIGPFPVANTWVTALLSAAVVLGIFWVAVRRPRMVPRGVQNLVEYMVQSFDGLCEDVAGPKKGRIFFPWVMAIFLYVFVSNLWEVVPGIESIGSPAPGSHPVGGTSWLYLLGAGTQEMTVWLRSPSSDLNFTLAIAIVSVLVTQYYGFKMLGVKQQLGRYFPIKEGPIGIAVGLLEVILEIARIISFGFRLFGNIFAGGVLLLVMSFLIPVAAPFIFYFLEIFVGFIQAFVFAMLTLVFLTLGTTGHGEHDAQEEHLAEVSKEGLDKAEHVLAAAQ
jgi:F-type H+-transporting ATPase subunit a